MVKALSVVQSERRCIFTCSPITSLEIHNVRCKWKIFSHWLLIEARLAHSHMKQFFLKMTYVLLTKKKTEDSISYQQIFLLWKSSDVELQAFPSIFLGFRFLIATHEIETRILWWRECKKRREGSIACLALLSYNWVSPVSFSTYFRGKFSSFSSSRDVWKYLKTNNTNEQLTTTTTAAEGF
jgi:hypothetical protein